MKASVIDDKKDVKLARVRAIMNGLEADHEKALISYICSGEAVYAKERAAFTTLGSLADAINAAYATPSSNFGELFASISRRESQIPDVNSASQINEKKEVSDAQLIQACVDTVALDLNRLRTARIGVVEATALYGAAKAVFEPLKNLLILAMQYEDRRQREAALFKHLNSEIFLDAMIKALGSCVDDRNASKMMTDEELAACIDKTNQDDKTRSVLSTPAITVLLRDKRSAALAPVEAYWRKIRTSGDGQMNDRLLIANDDLHNRLSDYEDLRRRRIDRNSHQAVVRSIRAMRMIARGELTESQRRQVFEKALAEFVAAGISMKSSIDGVSQAGDKFIDQIQKTSF